MKASRTLALVLSLFLTLSALSAGAAHAAEGGVVSGTIKAANKGTMAFCAVACQREGEVTGAGLDDDEYYPFKANYNTGQFQSRTTVNAGQYKFFFTGSAYDTGIKPGYLKDLGKGNYQHVDTFEEGSFFTVEEASALDLGVLNLQTAGRNSTVALNGALRARGYGGQMNELLIPLKATNIRHDDRIILRTFGCGKRQTVRRLDRPGSSKNFKFTYRDRRAHKHYGPTVRLEAIVKFGDGTRRKVANHKLSVRSFGWKC